jgi:hypothetical protein
MLEAKAIATAYLDTWNQTIPEQRQEMLEKYWTDDPTYVDPLMAGKGRAQIAQLIAAVHERFPGFRFVLRGTPDGHGDNMRLSWSLGPARADAPIEGSDFVQIHDGRIHHVIGFIDRAPAM